MIGSTHYEKFDRRLRYVGRLLGRESSMEQLHAALCREGDLDEDATANYVKDMTEMTMRHASQATTRNEMMDIIATSIRHALVVGVLAGKNENKES